MKKLIFSSKNVNEYSNASIFYQILSNLLSDKKPLEALRRAFMLFLTNKWENKIIFKYFDNFIFDLYLYYNFLGTLKFIVGKGSIGIFDCKLKL
jgi:hypothetical protein